MTHKNESEDFKSKVLSTLDNHSLTDISSVLSTQNNFDSMTDTE